MNLSGNILVLTSWSFKDALVQTYTLPYLEMIRNILPASHRIILVTEEQESLALSPKEMAAINHSWNSKNMRLIGFPYRFFGARKMLSWVNHIVFLWKTLKKEQVSVIHAFGTPAGSIGYLLSRISGKPLVIDSYEPHAESMVENGSWKKGSAAFRLLFLMEKWQSKRATVLIGTTAGMENYAFEKYGVKKDRFFVKPACVDLQAFAFRGKDPQLLQEMGLKEKVVAVYAGKMGGIYYKDEIFSFIKAAWIYWGDAFRFLMLSNSSRKEIGAVMQKVGLPDHVVISLYIPHAEMPAYLSLGDFGINPVIPVPSKRYCTSIKDGEYWAMGMPVVISPGISDDSDIIIKEGIGIIIDYKQNSGFHQQLEKLDSQLKEKEGIRERIRKIAEQYRSYDITKKVYSEIYSWQ
ncbi:MAG: glycosyltransferase [Terrimonas sp.]|nr:glycosyltransferase [Terrimonas sp.]